MGEIRPVLVENGCLTGIMSSLCVQTPYSSYAANHTTGQTGSTPETPVDVKQVAHSSVPNAVLSSGIAHATTNTNGGHTPVSCTSLDVTNEELIAREKVYGLGYPYHNLTLTLLGGVHMCTLDSTCIECDTCKRSGPLHNDAYEKLCWPRAERRYRLKPVSCAASLVSSHGSCHLWTPQHSLLQVAINLNLFRHLSSLLLPKFLK